MCNVLVHIKLLHQTQFIIENIYRLLQFNFNTLFEL